jgi:hypothetical protein
MAAASPINYSHLLPLEDGFPDLDDVSLCDELKYATEDDADNLFPFGLDDTFSMKYSPDGSFEYQAPHPPSPASGFKTPSFDVPPFAIFDAPAPVPNAPAPVPSAPDAPVPDAPVPACPDVPASTARLYWALANTIGVDLPSARFCADRTLRIVHQWPAMFNAYLQWSPGEPVTEEIADNILIWFEAENVINSGSRPDFVMFDPYTKNGYVDAFKGISVLGAYNDEEDVKALLEFIAPYAPFVIDSEGTPRTSVAMAIEFVRRLEIVAPMFVAVQKAFASERISYKEAIARIRVVRPDITFDPAFVADPNFISALVDDVVLVHHFLCFGPGFIATKGITRDNGLDTLVVNEHAVMTRVEHFTCRKLVCVPDVLRLIASPSIAHAMRYAVHVYAHKIGHYAWARDCETKQMVALGSIEKVVQTIDLMLPFNVKLGAARRTLSF